MSPQRTLRMALLSLLIASGCNTCRDGTSIPFRGDSMSNGNPSGDTGLDVPATDATSDASTADLGDVNVPDGCIPQSAAEACADAGRVCGSYSWTDNCGLTRMEECGVCDPNTSACGAAGLCDCNDGFVAQGERCEDVDECANGTAVCEDGEFCVNKPGTFLCSDCPAGEVRMGGVCVDLDECAADEDNCDPRVECTNEVPFFRCGPCPNGFNDVNGDGTFCADINECDAGTDDCDPLVECTNDTGGYLCGDCPDGYDDTNGDGTRCTDIDECARGTHQCDPNATCTNETPGYECTCNQGFSGDGFTCNAGLVTSVTRFQQNLVDDSEKLPVPAGINLSKAVPFATAAANTGGHYDQSLVAVTVDPNGGEIELDRGSVNGNVAVRVELVEFGDADVYSGSFSMLAGETVDTDNLPQAINPSSAFVVHSAMTFSDTESAAQVSVQATLSANEVRFERGDNDGAVEGVWYVVDAPNHLSVQRGNITLPDGSAPCATETISAVSTSQTFVTNSTMIGPVTDPAPSLHHVACQLSAATTVQCCRGLANADDGPPDTHFQVVQVQGSEVRSGQYSLSTLAAIGPIASVDTLWSTPMLTVQGMIGASPTNDVMPDSAEHATFIVLELVDATTIGFARGLNPAGGSRAFWYVVEWPH